MLFYKVGDKGGQYNIYLVYNGKNTTLSIKNFNNSMDANRAWKDACYDASRALRKIGLSMSHEAWGIKK